MPTFNVTRTGYSTWVQAILVACRVFHNPRFQHALRSAIGPENAQPLIDSFSAFCVLVEAYQALDDQAFKIDHTGGEQHDIDPGI